MIAAQLHDRADAADVLLVIRSAARSWLESQARTGQLPASAGRQLDEPAATASTTIGVSTSKMKRRRRLKPPRRPDRRDEAGG